MPKVEGSSRLGSSDLLAELKEISAVVHSMQDKKATLSIDTSDVDKAEQKIDGLDKKIQKKRKLKVETSDLTEAQKIIQEYGKGGRNKYLVSEEAMVKNLTKAYESYNKAISQSQKDKSRGDVMRWGNAYRGAGYDTKKVDKQIFDFADQVYDSFNVKQASGKTTNQMHYYSPESMKKLFDAMRSEAEASVGKYDFSINEAHWAKNRRDTSIGKQSDIAKQTKKTVMNDIQQGVEDASKEKVEIPLDDILNVSIGKGKKDTIQKKVTALREELEKFYSKAYDKEGAYNQKADNTIDQYIRKYSEYAKYMGLMKQNVEQRYTDIYENIHKFSKTRTVVAPTKYKAGQDDFAQLKAQEMASAEGMVNDIWAKAERKAAAQLAVGVKPSAKAGEPGEDAGEKIAEGMKKAGEATQEAKEKIEQVGETGKNAGEKAASGMEKAAESAKETRQEIEQASEAAKSVAEAEKAVDTASAKKTAESHSDAAKSAEEHAGKVKEVTQSIQEEVTATQQLNAEKEKSSQQNIQDNIAQQAKENGEALRQQAEAQREVNEAKEQSNDKSKLSSDSQEISQVEQMEAALDFQKKKLYDLQKHAEAVKQVYDDLQDRNEYINARRNVKGTKDKPNPFGLDGNLDKLYEQAIDHINRKEPNMAKAAAYYGFYRNAGGKERAIIGGEDYTSQLAERWAAIQKLNKAIREGSINVNDYGVDSLNAANEAIREQQRIVDDVTEKVRQAKKEAAEQRKTERELAAQEYEDSKTVWSQGLNEQEIAGVEAYLKKVKALKKEAYNETDALAQAMSLLEKIKKRDISGLMDQFTAANKASNAMLGKITNMPVNNQKARNEALRSLDQAEYDRLIEEQTHAVNTALDNKKSDFQQKWAEVVDAMLGGDAFAEAKPMDKGRIIKELEKYADTAKDAIDEINKQWLSGTLDENKFSGKYAKQYIQMLNDAKDDAQIKRTAKVGELDPDSLFNAGGTTTLTQQQVDALHAEAAAYDELIAKKREYYGIQDPIKKEIDVFQNGADSLFDNFNLDKSKSGFDELFAFVESGAKTAEQALKELGKSFGMVYNPSEDYWSPTPQSRVDSMIQANVDSLRKSESGNYYTSDQLFSVTKSKGGWDVKSVVDGLQTHVKNLNEAKQAIAKMINESFTSVEEKINSDLNAGVINAEEAANRLASVKAFVLDTYGSLKSAMSDKNGEFLIQQIQSGKLSSDDAFTLYDEGRVEEYYEQIKHIEEIKSNIQELISQGVGTRGQGEFQIEVLTGFLNNLSTDLGLTDTEVQNLKEEIQTRIESIKRTMADLDKESKSDGLMKFTPGIKPSIVDQPKQKDTDPINKELQSQIDFIKSDIEMTKKAILSQDPDGILNTIFYGPDGKLRDIDFESELNLERTRQSLFGDSEFEDRLNKIPNSLIDLYNQLYDQQSQLDVLQKDGLSYLQEEADIRKEIASVQNTNYEEQLDAHTLQISDEDAASRLSILEQTVEKINDIKNRAKILEDTQPFYIADIDDLNGQLSGLDAIKSKLEANIEVLRTYKEVQLDDQNDIWMNFADNLPIYEPGEQEKKLGRLQYEIDLKVSKGELSGQQAIEAFKQQAQDLGYVLDEVSGKWKKLEDMTQPHQTSSQNDLQAMYDQLNDMSQKTQDLISQSSKLMENPVPNNKRKSYYQDIFDQIDAISNKSQELKTQLSNMTIPEGATALTNIADKLKGQFASIDTLLSAKRTDTQNVFDSIDFEAQEAALDEEERIAKRTSEIALRITSNKDFSKYGDSNWLQDYIDIVKTDTREIDEIYAEFEQKLADRKASIIEQQTKKDNLEFNQDKFRSFLFGVSTGGHEEYDANLKKYEDVFNSITDDVNTLDEAIKRVKDDMASMHPVELSGTAYNDKLKSFAGINRSNLMQEPHFDFEFDKLIEHGSQLEQILTEIFNENPGATLQTVIDTVQNELTDTTARAKEFDDILSQIREGSGKWSFNKMLGNPEGFANDLNQLTEQLIALRDAGKGDSKDALNLETRIQYMLSAQSKLLDQPNRGAFQPYWDKIQNKLSKQASDIQDEMWEAMANGGNLTSRNAFPDLVRDRLGLGIEYDSIINNSDIRDLQSVLDILQNIGTIRTRISDQGKIEFFDKQVISNLEIADQLKNRLLNTSEEDKQSDPQWVENQYKYIAEYLQKAEEFKQKIAEIKGEVYEMQTFTAESVRESLSSQINIPLSSTEQHQQQEQAAESAASAEEHLKNETEAAAHIGAGENNATRANREQAESAREAAEEQERLNNVGGSSEGRITAEGKIGDNYKTEKYEVSKGLTKTQRLKYVNPEDAEDGIGGWVVQPQSVQYLANYNTLLQDTLKYTQQLATAEAALKLEQAKNSPNQQVIDSIQKQIDYYKDVIKQNNELASQYEQSSIMPVNKYTKAQYDADVKERTKEINLKVARQSAEQIRSQQAKNEAELKKNQAEIDKANHYVTQQLQTLRNIENKYDSSINAQASHGITGKQNLDQFKQQVKDIENFLNAMNGVKLDPSKMDTVTSMLGDLKRFGDNAYLGETAKKGDLSRQSVVSMKKVLSANIDTFQSRASLSNGDVSDVLRQAQELKDSLSTMFSGDEVSQGFTRLKELKAQLQSINEETKLVSNTSKEVSNAYQENINKIKALGEAHTQVNNIAAEQLTDKNSQLSMEQGLENVKTAAEEAKNALYEVYKMYKSGDISKEDFDKALQLYKSDETRNGSQNSRQKELLGIQKVVEELSQSYIKLADAKEKAEHSKTVSGREVGKIEQQRLKDRQEELKKRLERYNISEDYEPIATGKRLGELRTSEYEEKRNAVVNTKGLGFGEGDNVEKTWDVLIQKAQRYQQILYKQQSGATLTVNEKATLEKLAPLYAEAERQAEKMSEAFTKYEDKYNKMHEQIGITNNALASQTIDKYDKAIGGLEAESDSMPYMYNQQVIELKANLESLKQIDIGNQEWFDTLNKLDEGLQRIKTDREMMPFDENARVSLNRQMSDWVAKNTGAGEYRDQVMLLQQSLQNITNQADYDRIANGFNNIRAAAAEAGKTGLSFGDGLIKRFKSLGQYLLSFASFYRIIGTLKQAVSIVKELDSGLMEVRKVAQESITSLKEWQKSTFDQADVIGGNASQIEKSTAAWLRLGKSFTEAQEAAQASVKLLNVSEFENIDDATTSLVSMRQAFQDLTYEDFIDKLNGVGDNFSSSTDQLAQGMQNVSAVLKVQGNDIDQSLALLTAANDITQDMSKASMGVRTVALRIAGTEAAKEELEEYGEDVSDFVVQTASKVDAQVRGYTKTAKSPNGVSVLDESGRLRDTYDILLDIAKVYDDIVEKDNQFGTNSSNALLELLAGKTRSNILASILQNPQLLEDAYEQSKNSQGVGQRELDVYLDSIEARMAKMQNRLQELAFTALNSDFIKTFVDGLTQGLQIITKIVDVAGTLPTLLGAVGGFMLQKGGLGIGKFNKRTAKWGLGGMPGAVGGLWKKISTASGPMDNEVASYLAGYDLNQKLYGEGGALAHKNLADAPQALQQYTKEMLNVGNATVTVRDALNATSQSVTGFSGLLANAGNLAVSFFSTMGTMALAMAASWALGKIAEGIYNIINAEKNMIENGKKATDSINDRYKAYGDLKDNLGDIEKNITGEEESGTTEESISKIAEKYTELHNGVNELNNANQNLSTEKYQEYLTLCNQLAEQSPSLVSGYDAQGNAILNIGNSASEVEAALIRMYEAEKLAANVEIGENIQDSYDGLITEINKKVKENSAIKDEIKILETQIADTEVDNYGGSTYVADNSITVSKYTSEVQDALNSVLKDVGLSWQSSIGDMSSGGEVTFIVNGFDKLDSETRNAVQQRISEVVGGAIDIKTNELASEKNEKQRLQLSNDLFIKDQQKSIQGIINKYLTTSDVFGQQSDAIQNAILNNLGTLDLSIIEDKYSGEIVPFIYSELIAPISELTPDVQSKLAELFELKPENISAQEYAQKMTDIINSTFEEESDRVRWSELFGVDAAQNEINSLTSKVKDEFGNNYLTNDQLEQLFGLSLDDLRTYANLVRDNTYDTWEDLQNDFNKIKEQNIKPTDTLSDLINSDDYKSSTESLSSDLSSLTGALETLRTEGSLTAEQMVELQNSFPDLTEFTTEAIQTKAFEKLDEWIGKIREGMKGMSEEGKEQARTMIQNMIDQYGDLGVEMSDIMDTYFDVLGIDQSKTSGQEMSGLTQDFYSQVEELRSRLEAKGLELDTHVLYTLVASDQFSGDADEIYNKYNDAKLNWEITLDDKKLARDLNVAESRIQSEQAKRSQKEARGELITPEDYQTELNILNGKVGTTSEQTKRARNKWKKAIQDGEDQEYIDNLFGVYQEALQSQRQAETDVANTTREQTESAANGTLQELEKSNNVLKEAQNKVSEAEKDGGKASAELYEAIASEQDNQAEINRRLGDIFQGFADNADNDTDKIKWQGQANDYYAAAIQAEADARESRNNPTLEEYNKLQTQSEQIQREITKAEQNHQKVSEKTYNDLINNGKAQIRNLQKQQSEVDKYSDKWWDLQNSIDSMSDSIYEWGTTSESLIYDQASQLASAISSAMSESISETGLTDDTINALKTAFSDLDGSKFDVSDSFYSTADGVKVNTEALQELTEAEFELIGAPLANEIANIQAQLEKDPGNFALQDKLENLMETNAKYFAQYEEMQKALSRNAAIDLAEGTENAGANYDKNYGRVKTYKEAYENGLTGTDDFKAWTSYLDVYGRDTLEAYESVSGKIDRYFTEDASEGLGNFLTDMEKLGYAAQDADGYWDLTVDDYNAAAKDMQMGSDWFMDTMRKLEDYGFIHTYVSSLNEAQLKTRDVEEQIADAVQTYSDMVARGASDEELQKQIEHINELESQWQELDTVTKMWDETTEANRKKEFLNLDDQLSAFEEMYKNADTDAGREAAKKAAQDYVKQFRMTLNEEDLTKGIFRLSDESAEDYNSRIPDSTEISEVASSISNYVGEIKKAQEWGLGEELSGGFVQSVFGNVDMNKRQIIEWTDELKQTYADALASWDYQPENGSIDTVFGGSDRFGEDVLQEGVEVAFTPIMNVDGKTEFLGKDTVYGYIESLIADSTENGKLNIDKLFELDAMGRQVGDQFVQGIVAAADESLDYGELGIGNEAVKTGMLMHFSGNYGAISLASADKEKLEAAGFTDQFMQDHSDAMLGISEAYQEDAEKTQGYIDLLKEVSREDLEKIGFHNDKYDIENHEAEDALEYLADKAGITTENIGELLDVLDLLGINLSEVQVPKEFETLDSFLTTVTKGSGAGYQISTDIFGQSAEQLQTQMDEIGTLELQIDPDSDVYEQLQELKKQTEIQLNIKNSEYTQEQLKEWAEAGDRQQIANTFGIDVDSEEVDQYIQQIKNTQLDYDMVIHVDDTQFAALMEAITGEPYEAKVDITADGSEAEEVAENTKKNIEKKPIIQTIQQKIQSIGSAITGFFGGGQQQQQDVQASAQLDTSKGEKELGKFNKDVSNINKTSGTATADINISTAMGKIAVLKDALNSLSGVRPMPIIDQTSINNAINRVNHLIERLNASKTAGSAIGTAHAIGTTSLSRAYADGKDWTVGRDESALVNEIGQESIVRDGVWQLIPGGPHVEDLRKDDIIFNAEQTEDLIRTGKTARRGQLVAHANGTVSGMPAYSKRTKTGTSGGKIQKHSSSNKKGNTGGGNGGNNGGKKGKSTSNKKSKFEKWLEKLFDWIEVRLDRIQRRIDISTTKAENAIGKLDSKGQSLIGTISKNKNANINAAMRQIASNAGEVSENNTYIKQKNGKVTSVKGGSANTLLGASVAGALRYQQQADQVAKVALNKNVFKSKNRKSKASQQKYMNNLISLIHSGAIDIKEYSGDVKKFIEAYKGWYDKSQDLVKSTEELRQQYKELQQTKLDNIVDEFETLVGLSEAVKASSEATVEYYKTAGRAVGTKDEEELEKQRKRQGEITKTLTSQISAFKGELINAERVFGKNSNEYREAQTKLEEMNKSLIESQTAEFELQKSIRELSFTIRSHFITRVKALVDKLGTIASLAEKRGTISVYGVSTRQTEDPYMEQTRYNNELILKYYEDIKDKQKEIQEFNWEVDSDQYEEAYNAITSDESAILSLLSANEDLKDSIRSLRWKPYEELNKELDDIVSDLQHVNSFIRDGEILDDDGQITERGYAQIALIAEQMDVAEQKIRNANAAMKKLGEERDNDVISTEEYNEALDEQIKIIQDASSSLYDDQTKLADIYIDQITKENDILQDLIQSRKEALSAKKEYYDYDKTLRSKNKDIAQLQAQINALQGVTNDAAIAKRTKLQAELAEKQEDLQDTLYQHSIDLQQEGYDKLSEDMQKALDDAISAINGDFKILQDTSALMLQQLETNNVDEAEIIRGIVGENATTLHSSTNAVIDELSGEGGVKKLIEGLGVKLGDIATLDIAGAIDGRTPDSAVSNIDTVLSTVYNSLGEDVHGQLRAIELAIGAIKYDDTQKKAIEDEITELKGQLEQYKKEYKEASDYYNDLIRNVGHNSQIRDESNAFFSDLNDKISEAEKKLDDLTTQLEESQEITVIVNGDTAKGNDNVGGDITNTSEPKIEEKIPPDNSRPLQENKQPTTNPTLTAAQKQKINVTNAVNTYKKSSSIGDYVKLLRIVGIPESMPALQQWSMLQDKLKKLKISITGIKQPRLSPGMPGYAKGTKNLSKDVLAWTNENWDKIGSEMIVRPSDGAILTPLKAKDSVIPANLADNLFKWGAISPDKFITNPFVGKWSAEGGGSVTNNTDYTAAPQTVEMHFDSLFHIEGNVDESVMPRLENLGKSLVNDRDFQKNVIKFVTKDFVRESKKQGIR